jgi:hypothetical protein
MERSFRSRLLSVDEVSIPARARLTTLERLGFLRRVTKYAVVYQATKATTRLVETFRL